MAYTKRESVENKDFKARFEFVLTTTNSQTGEEIIICQRYFKIGNFNPLSTRSSRITDAVLRCAKLINHDLNEKSAIYTELTAPKVFSTEDEMNAYFANGAHSEGMVPGEGIVIRKPEAPNYVWTKNGPKLCPTKFNKYEFTHELTEDDVTTFTFTFKDNGRDVASYTWTNILPRAVKNAIDLTNKHGKVSADEVMTLNGEAWVLYKMVEGRGELVYRIVKEICAECCVEDDSYYTDADPFESLVYKARVMGY